MAKQIRIETVTVIGANGTMGRNVAAIFASFGNAKVYMVCRDLQKAEKAKLLAVKSVRADSISRNLIPADFDMLENCVAESDLVLEQVAENLEIKQEVMRRVAKSVKPHSIVCSGTSGLSITTLAECFPENMRRNFFGVHMFNPPYNLNLCELISTRYADAQLQKQLKVYLSDQLYRTVVEVQDQPAFLGNRIGFQFINEVLQYAEKYKDQGGIDYIDAILGAYTGRTMAPLVTLDFVGLDVHKAIVDNLYANTNDYSHETFALPTFMGKLISEGKLGRKAGCGLYQQIKYDNGEKRMMVYDIATDTYRERLKYVFPYAEIMLEEIRNGSYQSAWKALIQSQSREAEICLEFLLKYVIYALAASEEVGFSVHAADDVMAMGFNWCPPLAVRDALSTVVDFNELVAERLHLDGVDVPHLLSLAEPSRYDFRSYFKAKG